MKKFFKYVKEFLKAKWKSILLTLFVVALWVLSPLIGNVTNTVYYILLSAFFVERIFHDLVEYGNARFNDKRKQLQKKADAQLLGIIEELASEIIYPEKSPEWKKDLLTRVDTFKKEYLKSEF